MIIEKIIFAVFLMLGVVIGHNGNKFCKKMLKLGDVIDKKVDKILEKDSCCKTCNKGSEGTLLNNYIVLDYMDRFILKSSTSTSIDILYFASCTTYYLFLPCQIMSSLEIHMIKAGFQLRTF